jgi:hypothetical protein
MEGISLLWELAARVPAPLSGPALHRLGLSALYAGRHDAADRLFERAALRYREELSVEPLARLRVHQRIARLRAGGRFDPERAVEIERQLYRLNSIEALEPPHTLIDAGRLLATWSDTEPSASPPRPILSIGHAAARRRG